MTTKSDKIIINELEEFLSSKFRRLSATKKTELVKEYKKRRKGDAIFVFWFFSFHYAYVGKWKRFFVFFFTLGGLCVWWLIDLFKLDTILKEYNKKKAEELFGKLQKT